MCPSHSHSCSGQKLWKHPDCFFSSQIKTEEAAPNLIAYQQLCICLNPSHHCHLSDYAGVAVFASLIIMYRALPLWSLFHNQSEESSQNTYLMVSLHCLQPANPHISHKIRNLSMASKCPPWCSHRTLQHGRVSATRTLALDTEQVLPPPKSMLIPSRKDLYVCISITNKRFYKDAFTKKLFLWCCMTDILLSQFLCFFNTRYTKFLFSFCV